MERLIPMNVEQIRRQGMKNAELQRKREKEFGIYHWCHEYDPAWHRGAQYRTREYLE